MAGKNFTAQERRMLQKNKFVKNVDKSRITYTEEFKEFYMQNYLQGKKPTEIFILSGFDPTVLGNKRIERASARWRKLYEDGFIHVELPKRRRGRPRKGEELPMLARRRAGRPRKSLPKVEQKIDYSTEGENKITIETLIIAVHELVEEVRELRKILHYKR